MSPEENFNKIKTWIPVAASVVIIAAIVAFFSVFHRVQSLEHRLERTEDVQAIERLQYAYNYYVEHMLKQEIIDCFSDSPDVVLEWLEGTWTGKEGVIKYFDPDSTPPVGFQHELIPSAGLITVSEDGKSAKGRWYAFGGIVMPQEPQESSLQEVSRSFINGIYEMEYVEENNVWKILKIRWTIPYGVRIYDGWISPEDIAAPMLQHKPETGIPGIKPDIPMDPEDLRYVTGYIMPFHFTHPVTGKPTSEAMRNARLKPLKVDDE